MLRIGVSGTGFGKSTVMPAIDIASGCELVGVHARDAQKAAAAADEFGAVFSTDDYDELVARDDIDLVIVTTPPHLHRQMSIDALRSGKHVICEKPMGMSVDECQEMLDVATESGLLHAIDHVHRFDPCNRQFHRLVEDGYIGELRYFDMKICFPMTINPQFPLHYHTWRDEPTNGGGLIAGVLCHYFDFMRLCFGDVAEMAGYSGVGLKEKPFAEDSGSQGVGRVFTDDVVSASGRLESGALFTIAGSWSVAHGPGIHMHAYGSDGTLAVLDNENLEGGKTSEEKMSVIESDFPVRQGAPGDVGSFLELLLDFERVWRGESKTGSYATFADGLEVQRFIDSVKHKS